MGGMGTGHRGRVSAHRRVTVLHGCCALVASCCPAAVMAEALDQVRLMSNLGYSLTCRVIAHAAFAVQLDAQPPGARHRAVTDGSCMGPLIASLGVVTSAEREGIPEAGRRVRRPSPLAGQEAEGLAPIRSVRWSGLQDAQVGG